VDNHSSKTYQNQSVGGGVGIVSYPKTTMNERPEVPNHSKYGYHNSTDQFISEKKKPLKSHKSIVEVKPV
jgi:hypothetical protein